SGVIGVTSAVLTPEKSCACMMPQEIGSPSLKRPAKRVYEFSAALAQHDDPPPAFGHAAFARMPNLFMQARPSSPSFQNGQMRGMRSMLMRK
ncbi:MAG: hypothetical protein ACOCVG_02405, partial [Verrucomicrobiota bacterium]